MEFAIILSQTKNIDENPHSLLPIPISILRFLLFIFIKSTWTQRCAQLNLVLGQSLNYHRGDTKIRTVVGLSVFNVFVGEGGHGFERFEHGLFVLLLLSLCIISIVVVGRVVR